MFVKKIVGFLTLLSICHLFSCKTDEPIDPVSADPNEGLSKELSLPDFVKLDVNSDSVADYTTSANLYIWDGTSSSGRGYSLVIQPLDSNLILTNNYQPILLEAGDSVHSTLSAPWLWAVRTIDVIVISNNADGYWPKQWGATIDPTKPFHFIGVKFKNSGSWSIGWIKFEFNTSDGTITFLDQNFSQANYIIVGE